MPSGQGKVSNGRETVEKRISPCRFCVPLRLSNPYNKVTGTCLPPADAKDRQTKSPSGFQTSTYPTISCALGQPKANPTNVLVVGHLILEGSACS